MLRAALILGLTAGLLDCQGVPDQADPELMRAGAAVFQDNCAACHQKQTTPTAPGLSGLLGRPAASVHYPFSPSFRAAGFNWDPEILERFLHTPREVVPDNQMVFFGLEKAEDRAALVAFLASY